MLNFKKNFILLLLIFIVSCADNKKIPISGADVTSDSNQEGNNDASDGSEISVSDNMDSRDKTKEEVLVEELVEVGDRVFFDYDKSTHNKLFSQLKIAKLGLVFYIF